MARHEIIEHTADVGIEAEASSPEELFREVAIGLLEIEDVWRPGPGDPLTVEVTGRDHGALLVAWIDELIYLQEAKDASVTDIEVIEVTDRDLQARIYLGPGTPSSGTAVKAATFHRLSVEREGQIWRARVYLDI